MNFQTNLSILHTHTTDDSRILNKTNKMVYFQVIFMVFYVCKKAHLHVNSIAGVTNVQREKKNQYFGVGKSYLTLTFFVRSVICFAHEKPKLITQNAFYK